MSTGSSLHVYLATFLPADFPLAVQHALSCR
jgi:hypothetical protein